MIPARQRYALLLAVVVAGGALRFGAVGWGLPRHDLGQDELITATRVRDGILVGHAGWPRFHWPNLNVHLSRLVVEGTRWVESRLGLAEHDDFLIGRVYTALLGTLTLVALYLAAARLFDPAIGIAAAAFLAATPLHAFRSRLWVPDVPMTLGYTLALLAAAYILVRPTWVRFAAAGVAIGLATASKYNGAGACLPVVVAAVLALPALEGGWRRLAMLGRLALAAALSVVVFFAVDLFALVLFSEMLEGVGFVAGRYIDAPASGLLGWHIWLYIAAAFFGGEYEGVGALICGLAVAGWLVLLVRRTRPGLLAWLPALLYLLLFSSILRDPHERMFLPLTPHIALLAAVALVGGARRVARRVGGSAPAHGVAAGVVAAVLLVAAVPATEQAVAARRTDTRLQAAAWLDAHIPAGAFVMREWDMVWPTVRRFDFNRRLHDLWEGAWTPALVAKNMDYVVVTSTNFRRASRQRYRPLYARQAGYYREMFEGRAFELAARFAPGLGAFGPEVRIYRSLAERGVVLGPARNEVDLLRQTPWVSTLRLRRERAAVGGFRFLGAGELIASRVTVRPRGWYLIEVRAESAVPTTMTVGLGRSSRSFPVDGETTVALRTLLQPGKNWWRVVAGPGFAEPAELLVRSARLVRPGAPGGEAGPAESPPSP